MFIHIIPTDQQDKELQSFKDAVQNLNKDDFYIIVGQYRIAENDMEIDAMMFDLLTNERAERVIQVFREEREKQESISTNETK